MKTKHTQGEWVIDGWHISTGFNPNDETICDFNPNTEYPTVAERSFEEAKANQKIMVAAPELLEALTTLLKEPRIIEAMKLSGPNSILNDNIKIAEAAIKKATE